MIDGVTAQNHVSLAGRVTKKVSDYPYARQSWRIINSFCDYSTTKLCISCCVMKSKFKFYTIILENQSG